MMQLACQSHFIQEPDLFAIMSNYNFQIATSSSASKMSRGWARSGCAMCKERKKKCDETKPRCDQCVRLGLECSYNSMWKTPTTQTNKPHRLKRLSTTSTTRTCEHPNKASSTDHVQRSASTWNSTGMNEIVVSDTNLQLDPHDTQDLHWDIQDCIQDTAAQQWLDPSLLQICVSPSDLLSYKPSYAGYLSYYMVHLSRLLVMVDTPCNPLRYMVVPRMASSPMLLKAVCAVSACHMSQKEGSSNTTADGTFALRNYALALRDLTSCLSHYSDLEPRVIDSTTVDQVVLTAVFLCKYEIIRGSIHEWRYHLTGLVRLMDHPATRAGLSTEARRYLHSFITYHCQVATITSGKGDNNSPTLESISDGDGLDTYMGFTKCIVDLFGKISNLARIKNKAEVFMEATEIYNDLQLWSVDTESSDSTTHGVPASSIMYLQSIAAAYHSSAVIYFYSMVGSLPILTETKIPWQADPDGDQLQRHAAVMHCFEAICNIPDGMPSESALVLPLFIMGCESEFPEQQAYAIQRLRKLESFIGLGNISRARAVVEHVQATSGMRLELDRGGPRWSQATDILGWDLIVT